MHQCRTLLHYDFGYLKPSNQMVIEFDQVCAIGLSQLNLVIIQKSLHGEQAHLGFTHHDHLYS